MSETSIPRVAPLRFVIRDLQGCAACLCCPVCGGDQVHPEQVAVEQSLTRSVVTRELMTVVAGGAPSGRRGSLIALRFWCEQGHAFEYQYAFHKGQLLCELTSWPLPSGEPPKELWRD